jgi:thiol-disulfide isomerase/thioredoxin
VRRLLVAVVCVSALTACSGGEEDGVTLQYNPVPASSVDVDTPELNALKAETGMADCQPGPGGGALPAYTLPCLGGGTSVDLSSLKGPMVLSYWAAWCGPCAEEMPALEAFHQDHGSEVPVLGIDYTDQYPASALQTVQERGVTYPSLADPGGDTAQFAEFSKQLRSMPALFFVDADGEVAYAKVGGVKTEDELEDLVVEHLGVDL